MRKSVAEGEIEERGGRECVRTNVDIHVQENSVKPVKIMRIN